MDKGKYFTDGYIGTYYSGESRGIYHFTFCEDNGMMTEPELFYEAYNAKWVSYYGGRMAFPIEKEGCAGTCILMPGNGEVKEKYEMLVEKHTPCYILQDERYIYTANYHDGTVMVYDMQEGSPSLAARIENGIKAGCHQVLTHGSYILVPCLEQHRIRLFDSKNGFAPAGQICFPDKSGPRHGVFNRAHNKFYVVSEWSNELFIFNVSGIEFSLIQTLPLTGEESRNPENNAAAAAIRLTRDEKYIYISVRGLNILAVVDVSREKAEIIQRVSSGGKHPRDFILSRNEKYILTANRFNGGIVSFERDPASGRIGRQAGQVTMQEGVALVLADGM